MQNQQKQRNAEKQASRNTDIDMQTTQTEYRNTTKQAKHTGTQKYTETD